MATYVGRPLKRFEDPRLVTGQGSYVDDVALPDLAHLALLRSPHGHARIQSIEMPSPTVDASSTLARSPFIVPISSQAKNFPPRR